MLELNRVIRHTPLPSQQKFHDSPARFKGFSGPIGSGKSQALCQEAIRLCYLNPGRTGLIGAPTYPMLRDSTMASLTEILQTEDIPFDLNKSDFVITLTECGSKILLRSLEEYDRLRGTNLAWFGVDELTYVQEAAWLRLEGRLRDPKAARRCGFAVWTPKGFDWVYRRFVSNPVQGYEAIQAQPYENRFLLEQTPDFYERLKSSYDENFYRQEVLGDYLNVKGGLVYTAFDRQRNVAEVAMNPALDVCWAMDFNVDPLCSLVAQIDGDEVKVLDEIVLRRASTEEACEVFEKKFGVPNGRLIVYGDASGAANHTTSEDSDYQTVKKYFQARGKVVTLRVPKSNPSVRARVGLMNAKLLNANDETHLIVSPRCKELIDDFEQVSYEEESTQIDKTKNRNRTHASDALGYMIWHHAQQVGDTVGEQSRPLF